MTRVGFLGAYAIDNAGDVLVGLATRRAVAARVACEEVVLAPELPQPYFRQDFGPERGAGAPIRRVPPCGPTDWSDDLDALIIGGGGILIPEPGFAAFLRWDGPPAAWNGVGSQSVPWYVPELQPRYAEVRAAAERLRYLSVRNRSTERFLRGCGVGREIAVVPDATVGLDAPARADLLAEAGVGTGRPVVGVSVGAAVRDPRARDFYGRLFSALDALPAELLLFPFGNIYGDAEHQLLAARALPRARSFPRPLAPLELWGLAGQLDLYVCTRYHAMLAAYAQRVPFVVLDEYFSDLVATSKVREHIVDHELEDWYLCPRVGQRPELKLDLAWRGREGAAARLGPALERDRARLARHFDDMLAALGVGA